MDFTSNFSEMFLQRFDLGGCMSQLHQNDTYMLAVSKYQDAQQMASGDTVSRKAVDELIAAYGRLASLEAQYIYRAGVQDGLTMMRPDFLTSDLVY